MGKEVDGELDEEDEGEEEVHPVEDLACGGRHGSARARQTVSGSDSRRRGPGQDIDPVLPAGHTLLSGRCNKLLSDPHAVHMPVVCCVFMRARDLLISSLRAIRHSSATRYQQKRTRSGKTEDPGCRLRGSLCPISGSRFIPPGKGDTLLPSDA